MKTSFLISLLSCASVLAQTNLTKFAGINIAGFEFSVFTNGSFSYDITPEPDGEGQMEHFVNEDGLNLFRLPVAWEFLTPTIGGTLNATNFAMYDKLVQLCLGTGAHCIIDLHNYARVDGLIVGQGGPTDTELASFWQQIATKYANTTNIIFGVMNEPWDIPDITRWATSVQATVTAIREAGASSQMILLPGDAWSGAQKFVSSGSAAALSSVQNPDGTNNSLIFEVHKYFDFDGSGENLECISDHVNDTFAPLAAFLRANGRQALLTETGGGNTTSCLEHMCTMTSFLNDNNDVYLGYIGWGAGGFAPDDDLSETPTFINGTWTDHELVTQCIVGSRKITGSTTDSSTNTTNSATTTDSTSAADSTSTINSASSGTAPRALNPIRFISTLGLWLLCLYV